MADYIAVLAQQGLALDALLEAWQASNFLSAYKPYLVADEIDDSVLFNGRPIVFHAVGEAKSRQFACIIVLDSDNCGPWLEAFSCPVLGKQEAMGQLNASLFNGQKAGFLYLPETINLVLQKLVQAQKINALNATVLMPAASFGKKGIDELAAQTVSLLNAKAAKHRVFPEQLSFNCFPFAQADYQERLAEQAKTLNLADDIALHLLQAPVFHGLAMQLSLSVDEAAVDVLCRAWQASTVFEIEVSQCSISSAVALAGKIQLGRLNVKKGKNAQVHLWLALDDVQFWVQEGLISTLEFLLKCD